MSGRLAKRSDDGNVRVAESTTTQRSDQPNQVTGSQEEELQMAEAGKPDPSSQEGRQGDRLAITLDSDTGEILKYEAVDAAGGRRELSQNERLELAKIRRGEAVEDLIERSFEAGLACLLGGADEPEDENETEEDASFRRALLRPLMEKNVVAPTLRRDALRRAIVRSLIRDLLGSPEPETETAKTQKDGRKGLKGSTSEK
jgi:hypothetical protein